MSLSVIVKCIFPPLILKHIKGFSKYGNKGCYSTFDEAFRNSATSYESDLIIKYVNQTTKEFIETTKNSDFISCRQQRLLVAVLYAINYPEERLHVLDFGGGLGSHYHGIKRFVFPIIRELKWAVVETPKMARWGADNFSNKELFFFDSLKDAASHLRGVIDLVHISGTLQYVSNPYNILETIFSLNPKFIMVDRLLLADLQDDLYSVSYPSIYKRKASFPITIFAKTKYFKIIDGLLSKYGYHISSKWDVHEDNTIIEKPPYYIPCFAGSLYKRLQ